MLLPVIEWKTFLGKRGLKVTVICLAAVLCLGGIGVAGYRLWPKPVPEPPPVDTATADENADYAASDSFGRLPVDRQLEWVESLMDKAEEMDDDTFVDAWKDVDLDKIDRIRRNMRPVVRERIKRHAQVYHKLSSSDRKAFIDERVDELERWDRRVRRVLSLSPGGPAPGRTAARAASAGRAPRIGELPRQRRPVRREDLREEMDHFMVQERPDRRAKTITYVTALARRRAERGLARLLLPIRGK
jgi:hypothetical protein